MKGNVPFRDQFIGEKEAILEVTLRDENYWGSLLIVC